MNKQTEILVDKAGLTAVYEMFEDELKTFAELIVRECVTRLEQHHPFTKDPEAYLYAISLIEEHFGVEE